MQILIFKNLAAAVLAGTLIGAATTVPLAPMANSYTAALAQGGMKIEIRPSLTAPEMALEIWMDKLVQLESKGNEYSKVKDSNGQYSYGCLQFQMPTFKSYGLKYGLILKDDERNLNEIIYDCKLQKEIAEAMLREDSGNWRHWYTSVVKKNLGLPPIEEKVALAK